MRASLEQLGRVATFIGDHGFHRPGLKRITTWAILIAHAAQPSNHWHAQANAQRLLDAEGVDKQLRGHHPCIVLGVPATRRYFIDKGYLDGLAPFSPCCVNHDSNYELCHPECVYGVKLGHDWIHELVDSGVEARSPFNEPAVAVLEKPSMNVLPENRHPLTGESATQVVEDFKNDFGLTNRNLFKVAYSPLKPSTVMLIGDNPGGDANVPITVANFKEDYLDGEHDFLDESYTLAVKMRELFRLAFGSNGDEILRRVPTTNVSFFRSPRQLSNSEISRNREKCWPYIIRLLEIIGPELILCNGMSVFRYLRSRMVSAEEIDQAAPSPATGQQVYYRKIRGAFAALDNQVVEIVGFHHLSGYRWSKRKLNDLASRLGSDL